VGISVIHETLPPQHGYHKNPTDNCRYSSPKKAWNKPDSNEVNGVSAVSVRFCSNPW
jgi:hypothetical protein